MTYYHVVLWNFPKIGLMGDEGEDKDTVALRLRDAVIKGLSTMPIEQFKKMCEVRSFEEDPSQKFIRTDVLRRAQEGDKLLDLEQYFAK